MTTKKTNTKKDTGKGKSKNKLTAADMATLEVKNENKAFGVKLTEDDLAACIAKKMSLEDICKKFYVKPGTVRSKFGKMMAREQGLEDFFVEARAPRKPTVQKNGKFTVSNNYVEFMGWKSGSKLDITTDADQSMIVIRLTS